VSVITNDTIQVIQKRDIFGASQHDSTPKIGSLVSVAYVSRHKNQFSKIKNSRANRCHRQINTRVSSLPSIHAAVKENEVTFMPHIIEEAASVHH
jgi:hypothetical protein